MAGIGFELKGLYEKKGLFASLRATGYSAAVCAGPMVLGILLQLGIGLECVFFGKSDHDRELIICMNTITLLFSLLITSPFSMILTRFLADQLFSGRQKAIRPSFWGAAAFPLVLGGIAYGCFLFFAGTSFARAFFLLWYFLELVVCWTAQSYLTAIKEYRGILLSFLLAMGISLLVSGGIMLLGADPVAGTIFGLCLGYGSMVIYDLVLICRRFPPSQESPFRFLQWMDRYKSLALVGFFSTFGIFSHLILTWFSTLGTVVEGLWISAPFYDVPALLAFLTVLMTTVNFVVSVEVHFYPKYREYYGLLGSHGTAQEVLRVEKEMLRVLERELWYTALKQVFCTAGAISLEAVLLDALPLGFNDLMHGYFRTLCVGYGLYAVANTMLLLLLYFTDYSGALRASALFAGGTLVFSCVFLFGDVKYYGFGFVLGAGIFFLYAAGRLERYTRNLRYHVLSAQPMVKKSTVGCFTRLEKFLDKDRQKKSSPIS